MKRKYQKYKYNNILKEISYGKFIVIIVVAFILFLAIRPIIKHNKNKGSSDYGCYKCSGSSSCKGCNK